MNVGVRAVCLGGHAWAWVWCAWRVRGWPCVDVVGRGLGVGVDVGSDNSLHYIMF